MPDDSPFVPDITSSSGSAVQVGVTIAPLPGAADPSPLALTGGTVPVGLAVVATVVVAAGFFLVQRSRRRAARSRP